MDMALCAYDSQLHQIEFSGAKNPLIYIKNNELFHIKGGKKPIAGGNFFEPMKNFKYEDTIIPITEPTTFYIFSDGFPDQIGGPENRKFLISRFKELLLEIHNNPMNDQAKLLKLILEQWRGEEKQVDDIIIIGFRLYPK
jgi:serine phosphatase RsbU (regulator of sigma subunit)